MHRMLTAWLWTLIALPLLASLAGCGTTTPSRFYVLTPVQSGDAPAELEKVRIGIGPTKFPDHLQRSQIIMRRSGGSEIVLDETHRWAEPLPESFSRVLAQNLSSRLGTERLSTYPWPRGTSLDYQVPIDILRFDVNEEQEVMLDVRWRVLDAAGEAMAGPRRQRIVIYAESSDFTSVVMAQSRAVARLAASITDEIRELERPRR